MDFSLDYFEVFGLMPVFGIDPDLLNQRYRDLQAEGHPDRYAQAGDAEQRRALQWSTRVNEAYQTLKNPFERARYLLERQGIDVLDPNNTRMPSDFLMRQMDWREQLAEAVAGRDATTLERLEAMTRSEAGKAIKGLADLLDVRLDYPAAAEALRQYRFLEKFLIDIDEAYSEIEQ
jgi:molecular chaperone HscB